MGGATVTLGSANGAHIYYRSQIAIIIIIIIIMICFIFPFKYKSHLSKMFFNFKVNVLMNTSK